MNLKQEKPRRNRKKSEKMAIQLNKPQVILGKGSFGLVLVVSILCNKNNLCVSYQKVSKFRMYQLERGQKKTNGGQLIGINLFALELKCMVM